MAGPRIMRAFMRFNELTNENYLMYALLHYDNPHCVDIKEYFEDVRKLKYIKRLFNRYREDGVIKERLILNHLISFFNVFENKAAIRPVSYTHLTLPTICSE